MKTISVTNHKSVWEAKREFDLLTKRIITDKFRHHEFLLPTFLKKNNFSFLSLCTKREKKTHSRATVLLQRVPWRVLFFYVGMTLVLSMGQRKPITLDNFVTVTDCKSNRTVRAMPQ